MLKEKPAFSPRERIERRPPGYSASRRSPQLVISCCPPGYKKKGRRLRLRSNVAFPPRSSTAARSHFLPTMPWGHIVSDTKSTCTATGDAAMTVDIRAAINGCNRSVEVRGRVAWRSAVRSMDRTLARGLWRAIVAVLWERRHVIHTQISCNSVQKLRPVTARRR